MSGLDGGGSRAVVRNATADADGRASAFLGVDVAEVDRLVGMERRGGASCFAKNEGQRDCALFHVLCGDPRRRFFSQMAPSIRGLRGK